MYTRTSLRTYKVIMNHYSLFIIMIMYREHLKEQKIEVVPTYKIASKEQVKEGESPKWVAKKNLPAVSSSYHNYMVDCVIEDLMQHVLQVHDRPASDEDVSV